MPLFEVDFDYGWFLTTLFFQEFSSVLNFSFHQCHVVSLAIQKLVINDTLGDFNSMCAPTPPSLELRPQLHVDLSYSFSCKGISDLKARLNYSYHHARSCEHLNSCFFAQKAEPSSHSQTFLRGCLICLKGMELKQICGKI